MPKGDEHGRMAFGFDNAAKRLRLQQWPSAVIESKNRTVSCSNYCAAQRIAKPLTVENIVGPLGGVESATNIAGICTGFIQSHIGAYP